MKSNNIFLYIFIVVVIALIAGATYMIHNQNKTTQIVGDEENETNQSENNVSIVENLKVGITNYDTMNPYLTSNKEILNYDKVIFEPLINITSDYKAELCLAKSITKTSDTIYEIKIDTNIKWQDGSSFIAKDIQFSINKLKEINSVYSQNVKYVQSIDTPDSETAIITLSEPVPFFEFNLSFPILPSAYYINEDFQNSSKIPIGTGMYKIASIDNETILLVKNDRWRNIKTNNQKTQSITIHKYTSIGEIFNSFKLGNIDIVDTYMANYTDYVGTMGYNKKEYKGRNYDFVSINCQDSILSDYKVRRALDYAINKEAIISTTFNNSKYVSQSPLDYGSALYSSDSMISYSPDNCKKELEDDGWVYTNNRWQKNIDGYVKKLTLSIMVNNDNEDRINVANAIKDQLSNVGILINVIEVDNNKYNDYLNNKNYQLILTGITNSVNPDLTYFYGNGNIANYYNDTIISKLNSLDNFSEIQKIANEQCPYIGLYRNKGTLILNANVGGDFSPNGYSLYYNFDKWFRQQ